MSEINLEKRPAEVRWFEQEFGVELQKAPVGVLLRAMAVCTMRFDKDCSCTWREQSMILREGYRRDSIMRKVKHK